MKYVSEMLGIQGDIQLRIIIQTIIFKRNVLNMYTINWVD